MASSDDEGEIVPQSVTKYYFEDESEEPVSFSILPIQWDEAENPDPTKERKVFLHGAMDGGLQKVFKQVTAWKLGFQDDHPEISVLSKDKKWIKLLKPRKIYEEQTARSILITVHLLHFLRKKPESSEKTLWSHLHKVFSFENKPSEDDINEHRSLIKQFMEKDDTLAKSQALLLFFKDGPRKRIFGEDAENALDSKKPFITDDDDEVDEGPGNDDGDDSEEEPDLFDSVCAICDNGGDLLCCEGRCLRSFHATRSAGADSDCKSLGYSRSQVEAIQNFLCNNCLHKRHQCFACGKLGSSDKSAAAEVFPCVNATCGKFYHPKCVAQLLHRGNEAEIAEHQKQIAAGESFTCPVHKCIICDKGENKEVKDLQFAMCRRCPKSYHRQCLPRDIAFDDIEEEDIIQRAWDDLLPDRILIYCSKHEIDEDLGTPIRNHIKFPETLEKKNLVDVQKRKLQLLAKKKSQISDKQLGDVTLAKPKKVTERLSSPERRHSLVKRDRVVTQEVLDSRKKVKSLKDSALPDSRKADAIVLANSKIPAKEKAKASVPAVGLTLAGKKFGSSFPVLNDEAEMKIKDLMEKVSSCITLEHIMKKRTVPMTHAYSGRYIDKTISNGRVEGSVEAIRTALKKVEDGSTVEDAKAVCEPQILKQLLKWNMKLKVYLSPFLHGVRYTSFGRHFTKVDKLMEIVDKLQWYVQDGDMIVDFCCGSNDFSQLMKDKLEEVGKKCSFKNYDIIQPKNDFNFEKRDWMTVNPKELPDGRNLIMGLNPPFGLKASLANKFIDKALTFNPKLVILIVPPETERLDLKRTPYDLIWEDFKKLSGKSFYLPGSVDVNDKQIEQWNNTAPVLYLWSRRDFTSKNMAIAVKQGHAGNEQQKNDFVSEGSPPSAANAPPSKEKEEEHGKRKRFPDNPSKSRSRKKGKLERVEEEEEEEEVGKREGESDMSISPARDSRGGGIRASFHRSESELRTGGGRRGSGGGVEDENIDDIARRYTSGVSRDWRNSEDRVGGYISRDATVVDSLGRNPPPPPPFMSDLDPYRRLSYGPEDVSQQPRNRYDSVFGQAGPYPSPPSYGMTPVGSSTMQRYAPRLEETNFPRTPLIGLPPLPVRNGSAYTSSPGMMRDFPPDSLGGFAPGSHHHFPGHGSSGWLDD